MRQRLTALIKHVDIHSSSRHQRGMPSDIAEECSAPEPIPWPRLLLIAEREDGVFLERFTEDGQPGGDTWHLSIEDAQAQAAREYDGMLGSWHSIPPEVSDDELFAYARRHAGG